MVDISNFQGRLEKNIEIEKGGYSLGPAFRGAVSGIARNTFLIARAIKQFVVQEFTAKLSP